MSGKLTQDQLDDIRQRLNDGMSADDTANFYGRVADLDLIEIARIRTAAYEIEQEEKRDRTGNQRRRPARPLRQRTDRSGSR
ncbi:hypothetical protein AB4Z09_18235 [Rhodococcus sp. TAF43]|uniref:hypothetical protein n=1 Tax=Rhodococcus sp. TAF43 TaxID=3237483 RepID=UPI003F9B6B27